MKVTTQQILDAGINVFGLQLFLESLAKFKPHPTDNQPLEFAYEYKGIQSIVKIEIQILPPENSTSKTP